MHALPLTKNWITKIICFLDLYHFLPTISITLKKLFETMSQFTINKLFVFGFAIVLVLLHSQQGSALPKAAFPSK